MAAATRRIPTKSRTIAQWSIHAQGAAHTERTRDSQSPAAGPGRTQCSRPTRPVDLGTVGQRQERPAAANDGSGGPGGSLDGLAGR